MGILAHCEGVRWIDRDESAQAFADRVLGPPMRALAPASAETSVLFASARRIHELNLRYRGVDKPTDVLAFAFAEAPGPSPPKRAPVSLGDIVVSLPAARAQAARRAVSVHDETALLLLHGLLHLLGHDHADPAGARRMNALQSRWLKRLGFAPAGEALK